MAGSAQAKQKVLKEGQAVYAAAVDVLKRAASLLRLFSDANARIDKARQKVIKFIRANRGNKAKIQAELKKFKALVAKEQKQYDATKRKIMVDTAATAKRLDRFVKKNKAVLTQGPKLKKLAAKFELISDAFSRMLKKK